MSLTDDLPDDWIYPRVDDRYHLEARLPDLGPLAIFKAFDDVLSREVVVVRTAPGSSTDLQDIDEDLRRQCLANEAWTAWDMGTHEGRFYVVHDPTAWPPEPLFAPPGAYTHWMAQREVEKRPKHVADAAAQCDFPGCSRTAVEMSPRPYPGLGPLDQVCARHDEEWIRGELQSRFSKPPARAEDWRTITSERWQHLPVAMRFSSSAWLILQRGLIPWEMEDKWFVYVEDGGGQARMRLHRSWTGFEIYDVRFEITEHGADVAQAAVAQDEHIYPPARGAPRSPVELAEESRRLEFVLRHAILLAPPETGSAL